MTKLKKYAHVYLLTSVVLIIVVDILPFQKIKKGTEVTFKISGHINSFFMSSDKVYFKKEY